MIVRDSEACEPTCNVKTDSVKQGLAMLRGLGSQSAAQVSIQINAHTLDTRHKAMDSATCSQTGEDITQQASH